MRMLQLSKWLAAALVAGGLAACQQDAGPAPGDAFTAAASATRTPAIRALPAPAASTSLPPDHAVTAHYRIAITVARVPGMAPPLAAALRATIDDAKRQFLDALPDPGARPAIHSRRFELQLAFTAVGTTPAFISVRETGTVDTGGADPAPVEGTFVYDRGNHRVITLDDLFSQPPAARKALADFARGVLAQRLLASTARTAATAADHEWQTNMRQMLDYGTRPTAVNFALFAVRAGAAADGASPGLTLVFPPYQVAPYAAGTQTVEIPARVFASFLKPAYHSAFAAP